jgi:hypothetical protein
LEFGDAQILIASNGVKTRVDGWGHEVGMLAGLHMHTTALSKFQAPLPWLLLPLGLGFHAPDKRAIMHQSLSLSPSGGFVESLSSSFTHASCRIRVTEMTDYPRARRKSARSKMNNERGRST